MLLFIGRIYGVNSMSRRAVEVIYKLYMDKADLIMFSLTQLLIGYNIHLE